MSKLNNGHIDTATMVRLLMKHPTWTASAPCTENLLESRAYSDSCDGARYVAIERRFRREWQIEEARLWDRKDWTIHGPARDRKARLEREELGSVSISEVSAGIGTRIQVDGDAACVSEIRGLPKGTWTVYAERATR